MAFSFSTNRIKTVIKPVDMFQVATLTHEVMSSYEKLEDSERRMIEVQNILVNINQSLSLLAKYGNNAIQQLNLDGGLEALVGIQENLITTDKAIEALNKCKSASLEDLQATVNNVWESIKAFFENVFNFFKNLFNNGGAKLKKQTAELYKKAEAAVKSGAGKLAKKLEKFSNEGFDIKVEADLKAFLDMLIKRMQALDTTSKYFGTFSHSLELSTAKPDAECIADIDTLLHNDDSHLVKATDIINKLDQDKEELNFIFNCSEIDSSTFKILVNMSDEITKGFESMNKYFEELHKKITAMLLKVPKSTDTPSEADRYRITAFKSMSKLCGIISRYLNTIYRTASNLNSELLDFEVEASV